MTTVKNKTDILLKEKDISYYKLSKLIDYNVSYLNNIFKGKRTFPELLIKKLLPILEVSREEFESWIIVDKYSKEVLELAIRAKKGFPYKRKLILTAKLDAVLQEKGMSRTTLSKEIKYSQSSLNAIITGKRNMPESVLKKISQALDISQDEILSRIVADRHNLRVLESASAQKQKKKEN